MIYFYMFICSLVFSLLFVRLSIPISGRSKKWQKKGIPCLGGQAIYAAFLIAVLAGFFLRGMYGPKIVGLIFSSVFVLILGFIDDMYDLRPSVKIMVEIFAAFVLIRFGIVTDIMFLPKWANIIVTVLWVLGITNAMNLLDIMDGLASGLTVTISLTLLFVSFINRDIFSAFILIALIGAHLGFLKYNYPPAKVYMGDAGSLSTGFLLAAVAINISYAPVERPVALIAPLVAMSLLIYDTIFLIIMRVKKRKPIFEKTNDHFALRLAIMGYGVRKSVWIMYFFSIFLSVSSLVVTFGSNMSGAVMIAVVLLVFIFMGRRVGIVKVDD